MWVLGIDTSNAMGSVGLVCNLTGRAFVDDGDHSDRVVRGGAHEMPPGSKGPSSKGLVRHDETLFARIDALLVRASIDRHAVALVSVGLGPGSFSGVRAGIAAALGIAYGGELPIYGFPSTLSAAYALQKKDEWRRDASVAVVLTDAGRGDSYVLSARWLPLSDEETCLGLEYDPPWLASPDVLRLELERIAKSEPRSLVVLASTEPGPRRQAWRDSTSTIVNSCGFQTNTVACAPNGLALAELAILQHTNDATPKNHLPLVPLYVRQPDAVSSGRK